MIKGFLTDKFLNPVITHADSYVKAIPWLLPETCDFDVVLIDLPLSDEQRDESSLSEILMLAFLCPLIIITSAGDIEFSIRSISLGVSDYLVKDDLNSSNLYKSIIYSIERQKNTVELKQSEKRYSDLFYSSPQPMWVYDPMSLNFVQVNNAAVDYYGYTEQEFLKMTIHDILLKKDTRISRTALDIRNSVNEEHAKGKVVHCKKSGEKMQVEIYSSTILLRNRIFKSVIAIDVTEKISYERKLMRAIINAQENERYEIGGELHDNVCQILAASQVTLGMLKESVLPSNMILFEKCTESLNLALYEVRNLSHRLAPSFFNNSTLEDAFRRLFTTFQQQEKVEILLHFAASVSKLKMNLELRLNLYRILQEQLRNIFKHSKASIIDVFIFTEMANLTMKILDNGAGFNLKTVKWGIGMSNMKRRVELFLGTFEIYSSPDNGCEIVVNIPLTEVH